MREAQVPGAPERRSVTARIAAVLALIELVLLLSGPAGIRLRWLTPLHGFELFGLALLFAIGAVLFGLFGLLGTRDGARRGRASAWLGVASGAALVALVAVLISAARGLPPINDITTDPGDPPQFVAARELVANRGRDMRYPKRFAAIQKKAYPDLAPLELSAPPARALTRASAAARALGWHVEALEPAAGRLEATDVSAVFRFVDDIVVRVRPNPNGPGSIVDVRSKSRDGKGDLGVNAKRIRAFLARLRARGD